MAHATIGQMVSERISASGAAPALRTKQGSGWVDISWSDLGARIERIAAGMLTATPEPLPDHASVAILGNTTPAWIASDFGALSIALRTVPVYATLTPQEVGYLLVDSGTVVAICDDRAQLEKVRAARKGFTFFDRTWSADQVPVKHIVVIDPTGIEPADDWESLEALEKRGAAELENTALERARRAQSAKRDDVATYTYTSGTTGPPKGVVQTHGNMLAMLESVDAIGLFVDGVREGGLFLFLPLAHSFGRLVELAGPFFGAVLVLSSVPTIVDDLGATRPGFFPAAPRVFEKMKARIEGTVAGAPPMRQRIFGWAIGVGKATIPYRAAGQPLPFLLGLQCSLADRLVFSKLRERLGFDKTRVLLSGSAPLSVEVHSFFLALQLDLVEAYGLTETCPGLTTNLPHKFRLGTVGIAFPGVEIEIAEDGEILARGPNIVSGYLNQAEATAEAFEADGWFHTGDLGAKDDDGFVKITGRKKELMKTSGGKYIAPAKLEGKLKDHTLVQEAVTIADTRNYVTALLAVDPEELTGWAERAGVPADPNSEAVRAELQRHVDAINTDLARYETIKKFTVVPAMTIDSGLLTASLKVKRKVVYERYAAEIDAMYTGGGGGD